MSGRLVLLAGLALATAGCTERLTTPGSCPALCPGGEVAVRDTVIDAVFSGDSSLAGFTGITDGTSLLLSAGPAYGESHAVVRFRGRGDSLFVGDSVRTFTVDSAEIAVFLQRRDTTASGLVLDVYRLPRSVDTLITPAELEPYFVPANLLRSVPIVDSAKVGPIPIPFQGAELAKLAFTPADSTQLVIGLRLRSTTASAALRLGALRAGAQSAAFITYVDVNGVTDTLLEKQAIARSPERDFSVRPASPPPGSDQLVVGGFPARRTFVRFALPAYLRDSATIVRATLLLDGVAPFTGLPGDSTRLDVRGLLADFGLKSPVVGDRGASIFLFPGDQQVAVDIADLVTLWQGTTPLPAAVRLDLGQEWASFLEPRFHATRSAQGGPRLRITYRPPFPFEGF